MTDKYINLSDLKANKIDDHYDGYPVYQIQPDVHNSRAVIIEVGRFKKGDVPDIIINKFDVSTKQRCIMASSIYSLDELKNIETTCSFPLIKIVVSHNNESKLNPVGCMILFFHTFNHSKDKRSIESYISTNNDKIWLDGFFSISFHFNDKKVIL